MGLRSALRRIFGFPGQGLQFHCQLSPVGAAGLDIEALCGLGHDRISLIHDWRCYSIEMGYDDDLLPGLKEFGELRLLPVVLPKLPRLRRLTSTPGQEHLFDRYGYVPGVYELDAETAPAVIALLNEPGHVQPGPVFQVLSGNAVRAGDGTKHGYP